MIDRLLEFYCFYAAVLISVNSTHLARMRFTIREVAHVHGTETSIKILPEGQQDVIIAVGQTLLVFNSQNFDKPLVERRVFGEKCDSQHQSKDCDYGIVGLYKTEEANVLYLCGTKHRHTVCCLMNISDHLSNCTNPDAKQFLLKEGDASARFGDHLYFTRSGSKDNPGIYKYGSDRVTPPLHGNEQHYVSLVVSKRSKDPLQDRIYAFYNERNSNTELGRDVWLPFVSQVCMADNGGPRKFMQYIWTSQMNARLFCGDQASGQHFSELVDVATEHAKPRPQTKVYALFRNEWNMSAVCVYTIADIEDIFKTSPFKGKSVGDQNARSRACVEHSTEIPSVTLKAIADNSAEMKQRIPPYDNSAPLLVSHHHYTHLCVDSFQDKNNQHTVLFLSLQKGTVHKLLEKRKETFLMAEYEPFSHRAHILTMAFNPSTRKLYVGSSSAVVQLDMVNCAQYGDSCEDCIIARDPYCGWDGSKCSPHTNKTHQDVEKGDYSRFCKSGVSEKVSQLFAVVQDEFVDGIPIPSQFNYFLKCPVSSHHANYTWHHPKGSSACIPENDQCVLLIDNFGLQDAGTYRCVREELGYSKTLAKYKLRLQNGAQGRPSHTLLWVCLLALAIKSVSPK
ncbi:semaphorin-7A isoform X1 [Genypterus blacodes]|uniref:semaphorin-7A isoform X1 n=1 Tax=Genypterus blacodes TaxID=154954 RepID=UPI003F75956A